MITRDYSDIKKELSGKTHCSIAFTNGIFDMFHRGHLESLKITKSYADIVIVGINSDSSTKLLKGNNRPIIRDIDRAEIVHSSKYVNHVVIFEELAPFVLIKTIQPNFIIKGDGDYETSELEGLVRGTNSTLIIHPKIKGTSTTQLIKSLKWRKK